MLDFYKENRADPLTGIPYHLDVILSVGKILACTGFQSLTGIPYHLDGEKSHDTDQSHERFNPSRASPTI